MGNCINAGRERSKKPWLSLRSRFNRFLGKTSTVVEDSSRRRGVVSAEAVTWFVERDQRTLTQSVSFVPWAIQDGIRKGAVTESTDSVVAFRGSGAVVFCDASGFTKLTEYMAQKPNGAELLSSVLNQFFTPLIEIISSYRGDIIKFSGDALTILFKAEADETQSGEYDLPCGSGWSRCSGHSDLELAVLRAAACCIEIHKRLDNFDTGIPDRTLSFHIGIGCGSCVILHVGGESSPDDPRHRRFEYVICGEPLEQIAHACHYAEVYETVLSPQAWVLIQDTVVEGPSIPENRAYRKLAGLVTSKHTYATIRAAAEARDTRKMRSGLGLSEMNVARRYIPSAVYMQMENGTLDYVNEIRNVTVFFICVPGLDVSTPQGALVAQDLMSSVQRACYENEGQVNKFLVDDKGLLFLCVFGTPPMVHTDDPLRAIQACFDIIHSFRRLGLEGNFGLSTGRVFCGVVGSSARQEYTTLGDSVNLAARLMQLGKPNILIVDQTTFDQARGEFEFTVLEPVRLKGKANLIPVFQPHSKSLVPTAPPYCPERISGKRLHSSFELQNPMIPFDPLIECMQWRELKLIRRILDGSDLMKTGGTVVLGGQSGLGKDQLCLIISSVTRASDPSIVEAFATDQGQPRDRARPLIELIETCLVAASESELFDEISGKSKIEQVAVLCDCAVETIRSILSINDENGMLQVNEPEISSHTILPNTALITIGDASFSPSRATQRKTARSGSTVSIMASSEFSHEQVLIDCCEKLILKILSMRPVMVTMRSSRGTSLFNIINNKSFWNLVGRVAEIASKNASGLKPLMVILLCRRVEDAQEIVPTDAHLVDLQPLSRNCVEEYVSRILKLDAEGANNIPNELIEFIEDLTQGNPLYIMETLEQLTLRKFITRSLQGYVTVNVDLQTEVSVSEWSHTAMVGRVICQLESLAPQEAAIVKIASVLQGPFSVLDVAASLKSPYTSARRFDNYRMYRTCSKLAGLGILSAVPHLKQATEEGSSDMPINDMSLFAKETDESFLQCMNKIPMFILDKYLIRKVAGGMILQQQALKVKRQAMMFRVIHKEVPLRLETHRKRLARLHMPYFNLIKL